MSTNKIIKIKIGAKSLRKCVEQKNNLKIIFDLIKNLTFFFYYLWQITINFPYVFNIFFKACHLNKKK